MQDFKIAIANCLKEKIEDLTLEEIVALIEVPPNKEMGDFAFPCFKLAKVFRKAPNMIAADLAENIEAKGAISKVMPLGGYVNFFVNKSQLAETVINDVLTKKEKYGHTDLGQDKAVVIDFSSPNIAKPFHIGHIRTTVIGNALYKIYDSQGYNVVRVNHLGDYGTQFGKLIVAFKLSSLNHCHKAFASSSPFSNLVNQALASSSISGFCSASSWNFTYNFNSSGIGLASTASLLPQSLKATINLPN